MTQRPPTANACQRRRRARYPRIDYYPSSKVLAAISAMRKKVGAGTVAGTNSAILNEIVHRWIDSSADMQATQTKPVAPAPAEVSAAVRKRANEAGHSRTLQPEFLRTSHACARANDFGVPPDVWQSKKIAEQEVQEHITSRLCGAKRRCDGGPCKARPEPGNGRCKWHGGCSTGPRTAEGSARSIANLKQYQRRSPTREE